MSQILLISLLLPALISAAVAVAARVRDVRSGRSDVWLVAFGIAGAYIAGHYGVTGWTGMAPTAPREWLPHVALAAALIALVEAWPRVARWARYPLWAALAIATPVAVLWDYMQHWPLWESIATVGAIAAVVFFSWWSLHAIARRWPGFTTPLLLTMLTGAATVVVLLAGSAKLAQLMGVLLAASAGLVLVAAWPRRLDASAGVGVVLITAAGVLTDGYFSTYHDLPVACFLLVIAAPATVWLATLRPITRRSRSTQLAVRLALAALPMAVAAGLAVYYDMADAGDGFAY